MSDRRLRVAVEAVALVGVGIAAYLSYTRIANFSIICPTSGCATVQRSAQRRVAFAWVADSFAAMFAFQTYLLA